MSSLSLSLFRMDVVGRVDGPKLINQASARKEDEKVSVDRAGAGRPFSNG